MLSKKIHVAGSQMIKQAARAFSGGKSIFILQKCFKEVAPVREDHTKHRMKLPLYDLEPRTEQNWIAPSATIIGEV